MKAAASMNAKPTKTAFRCMPPDRKQKEATLATFKFYKHLIDWQ